MGVQQNVQFQECRIIQILFDLKHRVLDHIAFYYNNCQKLMLATLLKLNILLNTHLNGLSIDEINLAMISEMKQQAGVPSPSS